MLEVVEAARKVTGRAIEARHGTTPSGRPFGAVASAEKALRVLGWKPRYAELEQIISSAWRWHQAHPQGYGGRK